MGWLLMLHSHNPPPPPQPGQALHPTDKPKEEFLRPCAIENVKKTAPTEKRASPAMAPDVIYENLNVLGMFRVVEETLVWLKSVFGMPERPPKEGTR